MLRCHGCTGPHFQPPGLTLEQQMHRSIPPLWSDQAAMFEGMASPSAVPHGEPPPY